MGLDSTWLFREHCEYAAAKALNMGRALSQIMPNLRGPSESKRRLYYSVILSVLLYASPSWSDSFRRNKKLQSLMKNAQKTVALRVAAAYRTTSLDAATLLVRVPPLDILIADRDRMYEAGRTARAAGIWTKRAAEEAKASSLVRMREEWKARLEKFSTPGARTRLAILPSFDLWMDRSHGQVTFRVTQLLTGHGCFGAYLRRIGKAESAVCPYCSLEEGETSQIDTVEHTVAECPAWLCKRTELSASIGADLSLANIIRQIDRSREKWAAFSLFAERVMSTKEEAERQRQRVQQEVADIVDDAGSRPGPSTMRDVDSDS
ncbi:PREDICTED: uncharacterized protein LOC105556937 [Vollenhovia emeryi]|uniref:uncharacterized protein LOC105556937 n=1 Tax=Vollenhovia emeryi TaxID=411798 RepID=UPI0005F4CFE5|nr:PREDICTED: uncharacterized protein LOC105556937 [Vollenhovia emeryi]